MATTDNEASGTAGRRVIYFRPRAGAALPARTGAPPGGRDQVSPISDLAKFERTGEKDDYRHRMFVNAAALAFTVALAAAGVWIAESMAVIRKNQDCVLMGRPSCSPVPARPGDRWSGLPGDQRQGVNGRQP